MKLITVRGILLKNNFDIIKIIYLRERPPHDIIEQKFTGPEFLLLTISIFCILTFLTFILIRIKRVKTCYV